MRFTAVPVLGLLVLATTFSGCLSMRESAPVDLISNQRYSRLVVEIDYVQSHPPSQRAVNLLLERIDERLSKPGGVNVTKTGFNPSDTTYSDRDLVQLESSHRNHRTGGDTAVLYVLYLNGHSEHDSGDAKVLGVQYGPSSIAIFKETVDSSGGVLGLPISGNELEEAVLVHEFGHALGLVNNGLDMVTPHEDPEHPKHSTNENSVMYWAVENTLGLRGLTGTIPDDFDENDRADIRAAGGK